MTGGATTWNQRLRAQRHIRPHVNPLQRRFTEQPLPASFGPSAFEAARPLHLDLGCGKGHYCADLAAACPDLNVLGIEIREPLVQEADRLSQKIGNLCFLAGSANVCAAAAVDTILSYGGDSYLHSVSIQFPDPWPKLRHRKRRIVQLPLVSELVKRLHPGGVVLLKSDVEEVGRDMLSAFLTCSEMSELSSLAIPMRSVGENAIRMSSALEEQLSIIPTIQTERERRAER